MILLFRDASMNSGSKLRSEDLAAWAETDCSEFVLPSAPFQITGTRPAIERLSLMAAHLRLRLRDAEAIVVSEVPSPLWCISLLETGVPCLVLESACAREQFGPGICSLPEFSGSEISAALRRFRQDPQEKETVERKAHAHARRLRRRLELAATGTDLPAEDLVQRLPSGSRDSFPSAPPGRSKRRPSLLVLVLAENEEGVWETLESLERSALSVTLHPVVVLRTSSPELATRLQARCGSRAVVVRSPGPSYAEAIQAGLDCRRKTDTAVLWLESGTALDDPETLGRWQDLLHTEGLACLAPGSRPPSRSSGLDHFVEVVPGLELLGRSGVLWDLQWLDALGPLAPSLEVDVVEIDLCLRALYVGARSAIDPTARLQAAPLHQLRTPDQPLRCGVLTPALLLGGAERWIIALLEQTDPRIAWRGVALTEPHRIDPGIGAEVERICPVLLGKAAAARLAARCDVLVIWGLPGWWELLPPDYPGRVVLVAHGGDAWTSEIFVGSERAHYLALVSEIARLSLAPHEQARAQVIYNAVDPARVVPQRSWEAVRAGWGVAPEARVLGFLGRFSGEKDPLALARTVRYLPPEWVGVMIGWGEQPEEIQLQANALAPGRLRWPGPTADVGSALAALDTLLVSSSVEGFCYSLTEAWLAQVPTVSTCVGIACEHPDLIREIPYRAHGATIAAALLTDEADPPGTAARVARAHAFTTAELTPEQFGRRWTGALLTVAGANPWGRNDRLPGIQVVITGHHVEPWLERCLASVEAALQGCRWLLVLADDASADRTWEIIQAHTSHADQIYRKRFSKARNAGQAKNRALRLGLSRRKQYPAILFMDADDVMPRTRVTHLLRGAVEGAHRLVHGAVRFEAEAPNVRRGTVVPAAPDQHQRLSICPPALVVHESLIPPDGRLFCEDLDAMEDGELLCRWELAGVHSVPLPGPVIHEYWPREGSVMWNERFVENQRRFWERVGELRSGKRPLHLAYLTDARPEELPLP
jgi:glycosyltransferase involved in cell wall biosynthesis